MTKSTKTLLACAAVAGLYAGSLSVRAYAAEDAGATPPKSEEKAKASCSGKDGCKGQADSKAKDGADKASCKSKDSCKGKDGCKAKADSTEKSKG